jgi:hypothetical protein
VNAPRLALFRTMWVLIAASCLLAGPAQAANKKHHLTLALGYEKLLKRLR